MIRDLDRFSGDGDDFAAWLFTIARNQAIDAARYRARRPVVLTPVEELYDLAGPADPAQEVLDGLSLQAALRLIRSLPADQADAVALRVVADLGVTDAARVLGKSPGAVRVSTHRGLRSLAKRLATGAGVTP